MLSCHDLSDSRSTLAIRQVQIRLLGHRIYFCLHCQAASSSLIIFCELLHRHMTRRWASKVFVTIPNIVRSLAPNLRTVALMEIEGSLEMHFGKPATTIGVCTFLSSRWIFRFGASFCYLFYTSKPIWDAVHWGITREVVISDLLSNSKNHTIVRYNEFTVLLKNDLTFIWYRKWQWHDRQTTRQDLPQFWRTAL